MAGVEGRVALITGAGRGIGRVTAELLASRGAKVMCVARSQRELADVGLEYSVADLGTPEGCAHAVAEAEQRLGPIEILVCNHGIGSAHERVVWEQQPEVWSETMRVNLDGPFHLSRLVLQGMTERRFGRIVYTSSTSGLIAEHAASAYNSSKHGLLGLMRSVAVDGGPYGITSNAVLPGWVRTEWPNVRPAKRRRIGVSRPMRCGRNGRQPIQRAALPRRRKSPRRSHSSHPRNPAA